MSSTITAGSPERDELIAKVAVKLFGWTDLGNGFWQRRDGTKTNALHLPDPTTWQGMALVVDAVRARGWSWNISQSRSPKRDTETDFGFTQPASFIHVGAGVVIEWGPTPPMAFAAAALKACELAESDSSDELDRVAALLTGQAGGF